MIDHIFENIYIGEYSDAINPDALVQNKICTIINVRDKPNPMSRRLFRDHTIRQRWYPVVTDPDVDFESFKNEIEKAELELSLMRFAEGDKPTYLLSNIMIHCTAGMDRAPFIVTLYLHYHYNMTFEDAHEFVREKRKSVPVNLHLDWYKKIIGEMKYCNGTTKAFPDIDGFTLECKVCEEAKDCFDTATKLHPFASVAVNYYRGVEEQRRGI